MDLYAYWPGSVHRLLIDVSVRSPFAKALQRVKLLPGLASREGERAKHARYGREVLPVVMETFGRLGWEGIAALNTLRRHSADFGRQRPGCGGTLRIDVRSLRTELEAAVVRAHADVTLAALGCRAVAALGWQSARQHGFRSAEAMGGVAEDTVTIGEGHVAAEAEDANLNRLAVATCPTAMVPHTGFSPGPTPRSSGNLRGAVAPLPEAPPELVDIRRDLLKRIKILVDDTEERAARLAYGSASGSDVTPPGWRS